MQVTDVKRRSVGWYLSLAIICVSIFRILTPQVASYLLLHGGAPAIFWYILVINCLALIIFLWKFDNLQPH